MDNKRYISYSIFFLLNPLLTICALTIFGILKGKKEISRNDLPFLEFLGLLCCIYISLMNMQRVPFVDLVNYVESFQVASSFDFFPFLIYGHDDGKYTFFKEPLYWAYTWVLNRVLFGNVPLFKFTLSMTMYLPMVFPLIYFGKVMKMRVRVVVVGIVYICFFPYIFTETMNLVRQSIANSILCYVAIRHFFYGKREWFLIGCIPLVHLSSTLFLPVLLLPPYTKPFVEKKIWFIGTIIGVALIHFFANHIISSGSVADGGTLDYGVNRVQNEVGQYDGLSWFNFAETVLMLFYATYLFLFKKLSNRGLNGFLFLLIYLACFIVFNLSDHMLSGRYIHYLFTFMPFLLMLFIERFQMNKTILLISSIALIIVLTIYLHVGFWTFDVTLGGWITPVLFYMI